MLKKTPQLNAASGAQALVIGDSSHKENSNKGKGKAPAPKSGTSSSHQKNISHVGSQKVNAEMPSTSTGGVTPGATAGPSPAAFNAEAIAILREMHSSQNKTNEKVESLALKVDELYNFDYMYDENNNFEPIEDPQDFALYEEPQDVSSYQGDSAIHIDQDEGSPKRPNDDAGDSVFGRFLKKFKKTDPVDKDVNPGLAEVVNNAFREGMADDTYNELVKVIYRPGNCETLKETRVNQGVWSVLKATTQTEDSKLRGVQNALVKATINIVKIMDHCAGSFDAATLDLGAGAIGILGQANRWLNIRRRDLHKRDMDPKLHYLCSSSVQSTDQLYGDTIVKDIKDAQEINKISRQVGTRGRGQRGRGRGVNYSRGRGRLNYYKRRPSFTPSSTQYKASYQSNGAKNFKGEHGQKKQ